MREPVKPLHATGDKFRRKDFDPGDTLDLTSEDEPRSTLARALVVHVLVELKLKTPQVREAKVIVLAAAKRRFRAGKRSSMFAFFLNSSESAKEGFPQRRKEVKRHVSARHPQ